MELSQFLASWHPVFVHFPIGLLFVAALIDVYAFARSDEKAAWAGQVVLVFGTVGVLFTFITGNFAEIWAARNLIPQEPLKRHENFATMASWTFIALVALRSFIGIDRNRHLIKTYLILVLLGVFSLGLTGWHGGKLVYDYAAGIHNVEPPHPPTPQDLANLDLENTRDELIYSEMMHHIFGVLVLGLALWLAYQLAELPHVEKVRAAGPVILIAGGIFLMIFSDFDAWPLSNEKPITDAEVLAHKLIATLMMLIGMGTSLVRKRSDVDVSALQAHLVAVLALAGGGILMTHVHTGAPYSDTAIGVYLHHFLLGVLALACGAVKLLELSMPSRKATWNVVWVVLLLLVSGALLTYNEGLPWYFQPDPWAALTGG